jgi:uncharacterized protein (TIGR03437 family)
VVTWSRRINALDAGAFDFTGANRYTLTPDGSGTVELARVALGAGGRAFLGSSLSADDATAFEIYFGVQMASLTGTGVFLNPQGITSAASFFPPGTPIAPGEFVALFGTGMASGPRQSSPPYPATLNGVTVRINGRPAPLVYVSATEIDCIVPYGVEGPTATVVVQNGGAASNTVTVPVAATMPSVFSVDQSGTGLGAMRHAGDSSIVDVSRPATAGGVISIFLTGMGAVAPAVDDGMPPPSAEPLARTTASPIYVLVGGEPATILYSGLAPGFPGLYQLNVRLPAFLPATGTLPLAVQTGNAFHDQVDIPVR